jgi:preprotein translocase subunit YajC
MEGFIFILVLLALMWFLLIRPQRKRQNEAERLVGSISVGQEIVTAGGLYGIVTAVEEDEVRLRIADDVEVRVAKRAVAGVVGDDHEPELDGVDESEQLTQEGDPPEGETTATLPRD